MEQKKSYEISNLANKYPLTSGKTSIEKMNFENDEKDEFKNFILLNFKRFLNYDSKTEFCYVIALVDFRTLYIGKDFEHLEFFGSFGGTRIERFF